MLEYPGNVREYTWDEDGEEFATDIWGSSTSDDGVTMIRVGQHHPARRRASRVVTSPPVGQHHHHVETLDDHITQALERGQRLPATHPPSPCSTTATPPSVNGSSATTCGCGSPTRAGSPTPRPPRQTDTAGLDTVVRLQSATLDPETGRSP
jgi:hypothetical protein